MRGRIALITGGSRGIGAAIASRFRQEGASVLIPSRSELDLASDASIDRFLEALHDPVDILVNNAGINQLAGHDEVRGEFGEVLQINLMAPFKLAVGVARGMKVRSYGRILNLSSIWSFVSRERRVTYTVSKSGLNGLTRALALELAPAGILVNAVAPGYVDTELTRKNIPPEELDRISATIPLGRLADPAEIAEVAAFLCSSKNSYITGQVIPIDGGYLCR